MYRNVQYSLKNGSIIGVINNIPVRLEFQLGLVNQVHLFDPETKEKTVTASLFENKSVEQTYIVSNCSGQY